MERKYMAATHAMDKYLRDANFDASDAAMKAIAKHGKEKVVNATLGAILDDDEKLACLPTVAETYRSLPIEEIARYAPIVGLPGYADAVLKTVFAGRKPAGYTAVVATAGGTGAVHQAIENYVEKGDAVLTSDWHWGSYGVLCRESGCRLETFQLFDEKLLFNKVSFKKAVDNILTNQESLLLIINTPAHNPTGFSLSMDDWEYVLAVCREQVANGKKIQLLVDIAYIDYGGEKHEARKFMSLFDDLPEEIFVMYAFSLSKTFTFYGQRTGALAAVSKNKEIIEEFKRVGKYSSRGTWSNCNRGAMAAFAKVMASTELEAKWEKERNDYYQLIRSRAAIFAEEAEECGLTMLPYKAGFFISVPTENAKEICEKLHENLFFPVPLKLGIRIAVCAVPTKKMHGLAKLIKDAMM